MDFLDKNDFDEVVEEVKAEDMKRRDFDELIKSIDREIERLEKQDKITKEKNDFELFLEGNDFGGIVDNIKNNTFEDENVTYEQIIEALDKEIALLEEKVDNDNKDEFEEIIKKLDDEIARLENDNDVVEDVSTTRDNYDELLAKIDQEIERLTKEQEAIEGHKFDFNEIDRLNRDFEEYTKNNEAKVIEIQ